MNQSSNDGKGAALPILTDHAVERAKERCGWNRAALLRMATRAQECGVCGNDVAGSLRRYLDKLAITHPGKHAKIHGCWIFIFGGRVLVTVLELPHQFRRAAAGKGASEKGE